jgi:YD repeat-containing protein
VFDKPLSIVKGTHTTSFRKRDGKTLTFAYDRLNRLIHKRVPNPSGGPNAGSSFILRRS